MKDFVVFSYRQDELPANTRTPNNLPDRPELFDKIRARDLRPVVSLSAENAFQDEGVVVCELEGHEEQVREIGATALGGVGVIVNRLDRSFKKELLPNPHLLPALINENETRSLAFRKYRMQQEVLEPLGLGIATAWMSPEGIERFLSEQSASKLIAKPNSGTNSRGILTIQRQDALSELNSHPADFEDYIIQPAYDFTGRFPAYVQPYDAPSAEAYHGWNVEGKTKELRVYGFHSPARTDVFPVARAIEDGDHWLFVDPESLPEKILEGARDVIAKVAEVSSARALFGTVDYGFGSTGVETPDWHIIEVNGRMPYLVGYKKHAAVADHLRELFAEQINHTVQAAG